MLAPDLNSVKYYSDDANYVSFDCSVQSFSVDDQYIAITLNHNRQDFAAEFVINGKNYDLAVENGLLDVLQQDATFTISSASAYLGDGWNYPIVSMKYQGKEIIPYELGKQNYIELRREAENLAKRFIIILGSIAATLAIFDVCSIIGIFRKNKNSPNSAQ